MMTPGKTPVLVDTLMGVFVCRVGDKYSLICYADNIRQKGEIFMDSWYQGRTHDYETRIKKIEWLKQLKLRGFMRIDKEISFNAKRRDETLSRMIWYCINH